MDSNYETVITTGSHTQPFTMHSALPTLSYTQNIRQGWQCSWSQPIQSLSELGLQAGKYIFLRI